MGDRCEVPVYPKAIDLISFFYFVWPLKAIFVFYFYVKTTGQTGSQEILEYLFLQNTSIEVFGVCKIMFTVKDKRTKQDLEIA